MTDNIELLSDIENTNKELNEVFELLASNVAPIREKASKKLTLREKALSLGNTIISILANSIAPTIWEKILFVGFIVFMLAAIVSIIIPTTILSFPSKTIYFLISVVFFILFMVVNTTKLIIQTITQWESQEKIINKKIKKAGRDTINEQQLVSEPCIKVTHLNTLKLAEQKFKYLIEERQARAKITSSLLPILALVIVSIYIFVYGIPIDFVAEFSRYSTGIALLSAVLAIIRAILEFMFESESQLQIIKFKQCLSLLEQAQVITKNIEVTNVVQSKQSNSKQSFMSKLKSIKINAPEDFATNIDQYVSGEKRIEPDIR